MIVLLISIICVLFEAFFSGSEMAIVSINKTYLRHLFEKGSKRAALLLKALEHPEKLLGTTLLGTNIANLTLNTFLTHFIIGRFGKEYELLTLLITTPVILILGEAIPKAIFASQADRIAPNLILPLNLFSKLLSPLVAIVAWIARQVTSMLGVEFHKKTPFVTREELEFLLHASEGPQAHRVIEKEMVDRVLSFSEMSARYKMISLVDVISVSQHMTLDQAAHVFKDSGYSRLPVYSHRVDHVIGWISYYDLLLNEDMSVKVEQIVRPILFVPGTILLDELLLFMQRRCESLVMCVNEYGGVIGMITLEDVIEEVVGDIEDEHDVNTGLIEIIEAKKMKVKGRISIERINDLLIQKIPQGSYETLAGFLLTKFGRIPKDNEWIMHGQMKFMILKASDRAIEEVMVEA